MKNDNIEIDENFQTGKRADWSLDYIHSASHWLSAWYFDIIIISCWIKKSLSLSIHCRFLCSKLNDNWIEKLLFMLWRHNSLRKKRKKTESWIIVIIIIIVITLFWSDYVLFELRLPHYIQFMLTSTQMFFSHVIYCYYS